MTFFATSQFNWHNVHHKFRWSQSDFRQMFFPYFHGVSKILQNSKANFKQLWNTSSTVLNFIPWGIRWDVKSVRSPDNPIQLTNYVWVKIKPNPRKSKPRSEIGGHKRVAGRRSTGSWENLSTAISWWELRLDDNPHCLFFIFERLKTASHTNNLFSTISWKSMQHFF